MNEETNILPPNLSQYDVNVASVKAAIKHARYRGLAAANREMLSPYFGVGRYVSEPTSNGVKSSIANG